MKTELQIQQAFTVKRKGNFSAAQHDLSGQTDKAFIAFALRLRELFQDVAKVGEIIDSLIQARADFQEEIIAPMSKPAVAPAPRPAAAPAPADEESGATEDEEVEEESEEETETEDESEEEPAAEGEEKPKGRRSRKKKGS